LRGAPRLGPGSGALLCSPLQLPRLCTVRWVTPTTPPSPTRPSKIQVVACLAEYLGVKPERLREHAEALKPVARRRDEDVWWAA
jgi:hypothetical protein